MNGKNLLPSPFAQRPTSLTSQLLDVVSVWLVWLQRVSNFSLDLISRLLYN